MHRFIFFIITLALLLPGILTSQAQTAGAAQQRNFMVVFDVKEYTAQIKDAVEFLLLTTIKKGDQLIIVTPMRVEGFSAQRLEQPRKALAETLLETLKKDIAAGASSYLAIQTEMTSTIRDLDNPDIIDDTVKSLIESYRQNRVNLNAIRGNYEQRFTKFIDVFRRVQGDNNIIYIFQKQVRPIPSKEMMTAFRAFPKSSFIANEAFMEEVYKPLMDTEKMIAAFKYAKVRFHYLFLQDLAIRNRPGMEFTEMSGDLNELFSKFSAATNGYKQASSKASSFLKDVDGIVTGTVQVEVKDEKMTEEKEEKKETEEKQ